MKQKISDYKLLTKFRLSLLVVFSASIAFILGSSSFIWQDLLILSLGGFLLSGAASALNQVLEKDLDKLMTRTAKRPLADGRMDVSEAVLVAGLMSVTGLILLAYFNALAAVFGAISLVSYAFVYTPLKRVSPIAVWVGAIPGSLPMVIGWIAATGSLGPEALLLFSIQFFWQFPHFWAIAWVAYEDYAKAGFYLLPSKEKDGRNKSTALQAIFYALCIVLISPLPWVLGMTGIISMIVMFLASMVYLWYAVRLYQKCDKKSALKLMFSSFVYLPVVLITLVIDKL
ncbi:MAG: protoheme IX farnesyltransferase [Aureispira sp.]|nr:protoheme IX farnesyltransferase [Aureispira sp.]